MNDRTLLERAAWAAGINATWNIDTGGMVCKEPSQCTKTGEWLVRWAPQSNNGDALSLAVKMGFGLQIDLIDGSTRVLNEYDSVIIVHMHFDGGAEAATRKAIVRAAAAMAPEESRPLCQGERP